MSERTWTVLELIQWTTGHFKAKGIESARREAEDLLAHVLDLDRLKLYLQFETLPTPSELKLFRELVARRARREPPQYLLGSVNFRGLKLKVDARALIPRPETEHLAARLEELAGEAVKGWRFADIGTGSGCLALALLAAGAPSGIATDLSDDALALARENAEALSVAQRLEFRKGSGLEALEGAGALDLIVSNPPYIPEGERQGLQPEVRDWEPAGALFAGGDGLEVLKPLLAGAAARLKKGGLLALECGKGQPEGLAGQAGNYAEVWTEKDPMGVTRYVFARA